MGISPKWHGGICIPPWDTSPSEPMSLGTPSDTCPLSIGWKCGTGESVGKDLVPVAIDLACWAIQLVIYLAWSESKASVEDETDLDLFLCDLMYSLHGTPVGLGMKDKHHASLHAYPNPLVPMVEPH